MQDAQAYVDGINAYREQSKNGRYFPGEYVLTGHVDAITNAGEIKPFKLTDLIALASVVGGLFGNGGGGEVPSALALLSAQQKYGVEKGTEVWESFRERNDPEAAKTLHDGSSFPYAVKPDKAKGVALPDRGSVTPEPLVFDRTGAATVKSGTQPRDPVKAPKKYKKLEGLFKDGVLPEGSFDPTQHRGMSNALLVSGKHTASGHPVAVFGPQTGYFAPQLLMLQEIQGPGISARGASFAGVGMYVQLGRGQDYSWSATSMRPGHHRHLRGRAVQRGRLRAHQGLGLLPLPRCVRPHGEAGAHQLLEAHHRRPDGGLPYRMQVFRTKYGIVTHRATLDGKPVAYTAQRSTYRHEADSIIGFQMFNDPSYVRDAKTFQQAAEHIGYAFNWFYADSRDIAYYNSGLNPVRNPDVDPSLPVKADDAYEWKGHDPATNTSEYTPSAQHPQSVNQDYYISWNNKQAKDYDSAGYGNGSVHRGNLLDDRVRALTKDGGVTRASLTRAMSEAAVTDLRGEDVLPELLRVVNSKPVTDPKLKTAVQQLEAWHKDGAQRRETAAGSHTYTHPDAVRLMDAWWPLMTEAVFKPGLGGDLYDALRANLGIDESPSALPRPDRGARRIGVPVRLVELRGQGSAGGARRQGGGPARPASTAATVSCPPAATPCWPRSSRRAERPPSRSTPAMTAARPHDQWCADAIIHRTVGGLTHATISWQNRPTYQQVVEFPAHR